MGACEATLAVTWHSSWWDWPPSPCSFSTRQLLRCRQPRALCTSLYSPVFSTPHWQKLRKRALARCADPSLRSSLADTSVKVVNRFSSDLFLVDWDLPLALVNFTSCVFFLRYPSPRANTAYIRTGAAVVAALLFIIVAAPYVGLIIVGESPLVSSRSALSNVEIRRRHRLLRDPAVLHAHFAADSATGLGLKESSLQPAHRHVST